MGTLKGELNLFLQSFPKLVSKVKGSIQSIIKSNLSYGILSQGIEKNLFWNTRNNNYHPT